MLDLQKRVERVAGPEEGEFVGTLMNLYRNGADTIGPHSDNEIEPDTTIGTVSLGATRLLKVMHKTRKDLPKIDIEIKHGSLFLMKGTMQRNYLHTIPRDLDLCMKHRGQKAQTCECDSAKRISLTMRHYSREFRSPTVRPDTTHSVTAEVSIHTQNHTTSDK